MLDMNMETVLHIILLKALYGSIKSDLLWYHFFTSTLKDDGFIVNPYDLCVTNKRVNGKPCTITWYVNDLKISHVHGKVVENTINIIELRYGTMTVTRGKTHTYLSIYIDFYWR